VTKALLVILNWGLKLKLLNKN